MRMLCALRVGARVLRRRALQPHHDPWRLLLHAFCHLYCEAQPRLAKSNLESVLLEDFGFFNLIGETFFACGGHEGVRSLGLDCPCCLLANGARRLLLLSGTTILAPPPPTPRHRLHRHLHRLRGPHRHHHRSTLPAALAISNAVAVTATATASIATSIVSAPSLPPSPPPQSAPVLGSIFALVGRRVTVCLLAAESRASASMF